MINKKRFAKLTTLSLFLLTTMAFADQPATTSTDLPTAMVMAAGRSSITPLGGPSIPFIGSSINGGKTWEIRPITNFPAERYSMGLISSCTGTGNDAVCVAAGYTIGKHPSDPENPFVILSLDGTKTWNFIDLTDQVKNKTASIYGAASMGSGKTATIVLTGNEGNDYSNPLPLILVSTDGGTHWTSKGSSLGVKTRLGSISCTGEGKTALCMAGNYFSADPLLAISTDGGNTWISQHVAPSLTEITDINCTGGNTCAVLGYIEEPHPFTRRSIIKTTTDKGKNWKDSVIITHGNLYSINCTGSGSATLCAAVGYTLSESVEHPFVTVSTDNGATWVSKPIKDSLPDSRFTSVSCTQTIDSAVCAAVGYGHSSTTPLIVISTDSGNTWQRIQNKLEWDILDSVNCSPNGTSAYCVASTNFKLFIEPTLAVSSDLFNWKTLKSKDYIGPIPLPTWGQFDRAASTSLLALPRKKWGLERERRFNHDK